MMMSVSRSTWYLVVGISVLVSTTSRATVADDLSGLEVAPQPLGDMIEDLKFLTSDAMRGRSSVGQTINDAADYIAGRFREEGLTTDLIDGGPFQELEVPIGSRPGDPLQNFLTASLANQPVETLTLNDSFSPLAVGIQSGSVTGNVVWVGYGIESDAPAYNDYAGVDVRGKIVVMLRKEPGMDNPRSPFGGDQNTRHAYFDTKIAKAIDRGAIGVLLVNDPGSVAKAVKEVQSRIDSEENRRVKLAATMAELPDAAVHSRQSLQTQLDGIDGIVAGLKEEMAITAQGLLATAVAGTKSRRGTRRRAKGGGVLPAPDPIPVASIPRSVADRWLAQTCGRRLAEVETAIDSTWSPQPCDLGDLKATLSVDMTDTSATTSNVLGVMEGRGDLANETLVIGAHYDHVGMGGYGSLAPGTVAVHNGADDNASGTATLLAVANGLMSSLSAQPNHRRVLFIAFTAEERGLLGSKYYVQRPRFPISDTVAMINMDMVGRLNDNELTVYGTGSASVMDELLDTANSTGNNAQPFDLYRVESGYGPSDHSSFYAAGVPVLFFFTGLHNDYHRPSDDFDKLNFGGMIRITDMICQVSTSLATMSERPIYAKTGDKVTIRRQQTAFMGVSLSQRVGRVVLSDVVPDGPADSAGLLVDDEIISLADQPIERVGQIFDVLRSRSPGQTMRVIVQRNDQSRVISLKLGKRKN